jgi:predicted nucleic acid-binding protein
MTYLLDTNVVSELRKPRPHGAVSSWIEDTEADLYISAVTCGEIQAGIEKTRTNDPVKAAEIEAWLTRLVADWNILPMGEDCFRQWAKLMHRCSDKLMLDAMIAATAIVHGLTVATRNATDFRLLQVATFDPWTHVR